MIVKLLQRVTFHQKFRLQDSIGKLKIVVEEFWDAV